MSLTFWFQMPTEWVSTAAECGGREGASGGEERAERKQSHVQKSKCTLVTELKLALPLALYTHPFTLSLSLSLAEWLSLSFSVTRSPQPIKCGELVVNFSLPHTETH